MTLLASRTRWVRCSERLPTEEQRYYWGDVPVWAGFHATASWDGAQWMSWDPTTPREPPVPLEPQPTHWPEIGAPDDVEVPERDPEERTAP